MGYTTIEVIVPIAAGSMALVYAVSHFGPHLS